MFYEELATLASAGASGERLFADSGAATAAADFGGWSWWMVDGFVNRCHPHNLSFMAVLDWRSDVG
jgi:hypothetical protein